MHQEMRLDNSEQTDRLAQSCLKARILTQPPTETNTTLPTQSTQIEACTGSLEINGATHRVAEMASAEW